MTNSDHGRGVGPPRGVTFEEFTRAVVALTGDYAGTRTGLSRNTIHQLRKGERRLTDNTFGKIVKAYLPEAVWSEWQDEWERHTSAPSQEASSAPPQQLPFVVAPFTGRRAQLDELDELANTAEDAAGPVVLAVTGEPAVGKTALVVYWAHRVKADFPDGQLYVNLRGYDPGEPLPPENALAGFLDAFGMAWHPDAGVEHLAGQFRTAVAGKRVLVVLDNASNAEHVRPLLPGTAGSRVVVTSRASLDGLVAGEGARLLRLPTLTRGESYELLRVLIGQRVVDEEPAALTLAELCARLPLALRVAAVRVAASPRPLTAMVEELAQESPLLDVLETANDERTAIRSVLSWSYKHLPPPVKRTLRGFGLHPGAEFDDAAAAVLDGTDRRAARRSLNALVAANLLTEEADGRHGAHDLLREWAAELEDDPRARTEALTRLFDYYVERGTATGDPEATRTWLRREHANLIDATSYMADHHWHSHLVAMSGALSEYLAVAGYPGQAITLHRNAVTAAEALDDARARAEAHLALGTVQWRTGRYADAEHSFASARDLFRDLEDRGGEGRALIGLGSTYHYYRRLEPARNTLTEAVEILRDGVEPVALARALGSLASVHHALGDITTSVGHLRRTAQIFREQGDRVREGRAMGNLGADYHVLRDYDQARECYTEALDIHEQEGDRSAEGRAHLGLGRLADHDGNPAEAHEHFLTATGIFEDIEDRDGMVSVLSELGAHHRSRGDLDQAVTVGRQACDLASQIEERESQAEALNSLGETLHARGDDHCALERHRAALDIAEDTGNLYEQARAHVGIGTALIPVDRSGARTHLTKALQLRGRLEIPGADEIAALLKSVD